MRTVIIAAVALTLTSIGARAADSLPTGVLLDTTKTSAGQEITVPEHPQVHAAVFQYPPGWASEWHMHKYPRYVYVLEGTLSVEAEDGTKSSVEAGHMSIEMMNRWHHGMNTGSVPVKFMVLDQAPVGAGANMIMRGKESTDASAAKQK